MKTTFISTHGLTSATRQSLLKMQSELASAQKEATTGRFADVGLSLGARTGQTVSLRQEHARLTAIIDTNGLVTSRLEATQTAMTDIASGAQSFLEALVVAKGGHSAKLLAGTAAAGLDRLQGALNTTHNGEYIFAGINTDVRPMAPYEAGSTAKAAVDAAFLARFGVVQDDPAVAAIAAADMKDFLATDFAALFEPAGWSGTWSTASSQNIRSRISPSELVETGSSANESGVRKLAMAFAMVAELGADRLNATAFQAVVAEATALVGVAVQELNGAQARHGAAQERVATANTRMALQLDILATHVDALEGVDPYEATTRVSELMTQIETAYALTAQIRRLSILNYL